MDDKRTLLGDRRQNKDIPRVPFKGSNGATLWECRRKIPDRRIGDIEAERLDGFVFW